MSEYIVDTFGIVQDFADLHGDMNTPLYQAIMDVMVSRQREEIVRCRDCKHCTQRDAIFPPIVCERWGYYNFKTEPDRFCAWGERRTEQNGLKRSSDAE